MLCYSTTSKQKLRKFLWRIKNGFRRNPSPTSQILTICRIFEGARAKNLKATRLFVDFSKAFNSLHRRKMEQILLEYSLSRKTVTAIMMLNKNTKMKVRSLNGTDFFDIVIGVLQGDTLAPYLFIICLDYVLRTPIVLMKENGLILKKVRSRRYPAQTITNTDYADDIALLANTPTQAESLLQSLDHWPPCECWQNGVHVF